MLLTETDRPKICQLGTNRSKELQVATFLTFRLFPQPVGEVFPQNVLFMLDFEENVQNSRWLDDTRQFALFVRIEM